MNAFVHFRMATRLPWHLCVPHRRFHYPSQFLGEEVLQVPLTRSSIMRVAQSIAVPVTVPSGLEHRFPFLWMVSTSFKTMNEVFSIRPNFIPGTCLQTRCGQLPDYPVKHNFCAMSRTRCCSHNRSLWPAGSLQSEWVCLCTDEVCWQRDPLGMLLATLMIPWK